MQPLSTTFFNLIGEMVLDRAAIKILHSAEIVAGWNAPGILGLISEV